MKPYQAEGLLYTKLMSFIPKNVKIPRFLKDIPNNNFYSAQVKLLKNLIETGKFDDPMFTKENWENCLLYLLYLLKNNEIEENQGITVLTFLMALKSDYEVNIININNDENKDFKERFINDMVEKAKKSNIFLDKNKINEEISKLQGVNAWVMATSPSADIRERIFLEKTIISGSGPFLYGTFDHYKIPSAGIMNIFATQINPRPIKFYPIFGRISLATLKKLHTLGYHPLQMHGGSFVRDNLEKAHERDLSSLAVLLHDYYHVYSGSLLNEEEHTYLFDVLIKNLDKMILFLIEMEKKNGHLKNSKFINTLESISNQLADMDVGKYKLNFGRSFQSWLADQINFGNNINEYLHVIDSVSLNTMINFYHNLYTSSKQAKVMIKHFSELVPPIARMMENFINQQNSLAENNIIENNIKVITNFCNQAHLKQLEVFLSLLQNSKTADDFNNNLSSNYPGIHYDLIKLGFISVSSISGFDELLKRRFSFNDDDFKQIKKLQKIVEGKIDNFSNQFNMILSNQESNTNNGPDVVDSIKKVSKI